MLHYGYYDCALQILPVNPCSTSFSSRVIPVSRNLAMYSFDAQSKSPPFLSFLYGTCEGLVLQDGECTAYN